MEKNQIFQKLNDNIQNLEIVRNEISMMELAIYQKNIEKLKEQKLKELREFFEQQSNNYGQRIKKYEFEINKNIEKYKQQIDKLINVYDIIYIYVFKVMQNAINNQNIAMANIVTLAENLNKEITHEEFTRIYNTIIASAEKKLNYEVIVDECKARIRWCIQNFQIDINEIFASNNYQLQIYKENIFCKLRKMISNKISGGKKYIKFLENYETKIMKNIKAKNNLKILEITSTLQGFMKQIKIVKEQISINYEENI